MGFGSSSTTHALEPFTTLVVGRLPRPQWLRELIEQRKHGGISYEEADKLLDDAVPSAIRLQERAGIDYVSDGEWRRESYVKVFSEHVTGFTLAAKQSVGANVTAPIVTAPIEQHSDLATEAAQYLLQCATGRTIVALPSPYILGWRLWKAELSTGAYPTREEFMQACIPIVREEIRKLTQLGVDHVQLDEPWLLMIADPAIREQIGAGNLAGEIDLCIRTINETVTGVEVPRSMHLCHGHFNRRRSSDTGYEPIIEALGDIQVGRFAMEFAAPQSHGIEALSKFPKEKGLGLGVIDHCDARVESPEDVVSRAEAAIRYVDAERITLNPDCGCSPGVQNPMDLDEAYLKLSALAGGAAMLKSG